MIPGATRKKNALSTGTALLLLLSMIAVLLSTGGGGMTPVPASGAGLNATVTIKTQEAADNVTNGIRGIDVSVYQGNINWTRVANDNVHFAMIRSSFGLETDKNFVKNVNGATDAGLKVGVYHYAKFTDHASMVKEAEYFIGLLDSVNNKVTYPVILDLEGNSHKAMGKSKLTPLAIEFMEMVQAKGYTVYIYSYDNFFRDSLDVSQLRDFDFWVANYVSEPNRGQKMWQHTSYGTVDGISGRVDINIAYEDLSVNKRVKVNKEYSDSIKRTLNERYNAGLDLDGLDMDAMNRVVVEGVQSELVRQLNADIPVNGIFSDATFFALEEVPFTYNETSGSITYLIQIKLFYKGYYVNQPNGVYDDQMYEAIQKFQTAHEKLSPTGQLDRNTIWYLFQ